MLYDQVVKLVSVRRTACVTLARSVFVHVKIAVVLPSLQLEAGAETNERGRSNCFDLQRKMQRCCWLGPCVNKEMRMI